MWVTTLPTGGVRLVVGFLNLHVVPCEGGVNVTWTGAGIVRVGDAGPFLVGTRSPRLTTRLKWGQQVLLFTNGDDVDLVARHRGDFDRLYIDAPAGIPIQRQDADADRPLFRGRGAPS